MKIAVIIPARYESTRLSGKPLALIAGKPMIQHVFERCAKSRLAAYVAVATDDSRIVSAVQSFGGKAVLTSAACRSGSDRAADAARQLGLSDNDIVVNVQGDQPLIAPECIDQVVAPFHSETGIEMTTLAYQITDPRERTDPKDVKVVMDQQGFALYFSRAPIPVSRDGGPEHPMFKHLGVYAYTCRFLDRFRDLPAGPLEELEKLEQLRVLEHGYKIRTIITLHDSPEVDLPEDIQRIEAKIMEMGLLP